MLSIWYRVVLSYVFIFRVFDYTRVPSYHNLSENSVEYKYVEIILQTFQSPEVSSKKFIADTPLRNNMHVRIGR